MKKKKGLICPPIFIDSEVILYSHWWCQNCIDSSLSLNDSMCSSQRWKENLQVWA